MRRRRRSGAGRSSSGSPHAPTASDDQRRSTSAATRASRRRHRRARRRSGRPPRRRPGPRPRRDRRGGARARRRGRGRGRRPRRRRGGRPPRPRAKRSKMIDALVGRHARARVLDGDLHGVVDLAQRHDGRAVAVLRGVVEQVGDDAGEAPLVGARRSRLRARRRARSGTSRWPDASTAWSTNSARRISSRSRRTAPAS